MRRWVAHHDGWIVVIGDVAGKGVRAAPMAALVRHGARFVSSRRAAVRSGRRFPATGLIRKTRRAAFSRRAVDVPSGLSAAADLARASAAARADRRSRGWRRFRSPLPSQDYVPCAFFCRLDPKDELDRIADAHLQRIADLIEHDLLKRRERRRVALAELHVSPTHCDEVSAIGFDCAAGSHSFRHRGRRRRVSADHAPYCNGAMPPVGRSPTWRGQN
jgi:hypothetical protein